MLSEALESDILVSLYSLPGLFVRTTSSYFHTSP